MARLPAPKTHEVERLDAWLKGPVYYGSHVSLRTSSGSEGIVFAVHTDGDQRPAIVGRWSVPSAPGPGALDPDADPA
jgi:hypothetical protein